MEYLKVKNWSKFQHYKTRNPPWIKLHRTLLADYEFAELTDIQKVQIILIWLEAATHDGLVPFDANFLRRRLGLKHNPDLITLINKGWLIETLAPTASTKQIRTDKIREEMANPVFKEFPKAQTTPPEQIERNRAIASALALGNVDEAARIRGKA